MYRKLFLPSISVQRSPSNHYRKWRNTVSQARDSISRTQSQTSRDIFKPFRIRISLFLSFSFGIVMTNAFIHSRSSWHWQATKIAKQLSTATTPLCFSFYRCRVDVLQNSVKSIPFGAGRHVPVSLLAEVLLRRERSLLAGKGSLVCVELPPLLRKKNRTRGIYDWPLLIV